MTVIPAESYLPAVRSATAIFAHYGPCSLAALSRELAANDWQDRTDARRGSVEDRNVELLVPAPFAAGGHVQASADQVLVSRSA